MKGIYSKHLKEALRDVISSTAPQFQPFTVRVPKHNRDSSTMMPGEQVFVWRPREKFLGFVSFVPHRTQERFAADVGWSKRQRFPWDVQRPTSYVEAVSGIGAEEAMVDFADVLNQTTGSGVFVGWDVWKCRVPPEHPMFKQIFVAEDLRQVGDDEAKQRTRNAAEEAVADIMKYGMPFLESACARHRV